jgi:uncharacterized protein (TIRG00374 family)
MSRKLLFFLILAVFALAVYALTGRDFDSQLFFESLAGVRPAWLVASIGITFLSYGIRSIRWQILLISLKPIKLAHLMSANLLGFSAIYVLGRAGEFVRPVWIARREGVAMAGSFAAIIVERVFDTIMLILLFAATIGTAQLPISAQGAIGLLTTSTWLLLGISTGAMLAFIIFHKHIDKVTVYIPFRRLVGMLEQFAEGLAITGNWKNLGLTTVYSFLLWLVIALQFWFMMFGLNFDFTFQSATLVLVASAIGSIAQVPGIGGGFQAAFIFCVTTLFLVPLETAVAASLLAWFFTIVPTMVVAAFYMLWKGVSAKDLMGPEEGLTTP